MGADVMSARHCYNWDGPQQARYPVGLVALASAA